MQGGVDLFNNAAPALGQNGTYNSYTFAATAQSFLTEHDPNSPFFMYLALHNVHQPVEAPPDFVNRYPASDYNSSTISRRIYNAMVGPRLGIAQCAGLMMLRNAMGTALGCG